MQRSPTSGRPHRSACGPQPECRSIDMITAPVVACILNDRTTQVVTRPPDKPGLGLPDSGFGPFTVSSCGLRVFYKGTIFCAPPSSDLQRLCKM